MLCECSTYDWSEVSRRLEHHPDCPSLKPAEKPLGCGSYIDGVWKHCIYKPWHEPPHVYREEQ